jgi:hypothetical protein
LAESTINTCFCRKPRCLDDLLEERRRGPVRVQVEQIIQLTYEQYQHFLSHIWEDMPFFEAHKRSTDCDSKGVSRCLLVTARNIRGGVLVDCQGYSFARYAADLPDKSILDLRDVPIDHYDLKLRQPRCQRER